MVQQQTATTKRSKKNNKMLLEKWQENEKHLREKGFKSTKLNKWNYHAMIRFEKKEKTFALFHTIPIIFPSLIIVLLIW